jgi:hypothetical protein
MHIHMHTGLHKQKLRHVASEGNLTYLMFREARKAFSKKVTLGLRSARWVRGSKARRER